MDELDVRPECPDPDEYRRLRVAAGLSPKTREAAETGLPGTLYAVCVRNANQLVGMGRIVGDGGLNYEIVDMAVAPGYQRRGIGYRIMELLMAGLDEHAPESAYVSLIADHGAPALYEKFGFSFTAPVSVGMALTIRRDTAQ